MVSVKLMWCHFQAKAALYRQKIYYIFYPVKVKTAPLHAVEGCRCNSTYISTSAEDERTRTISLSDLILSIDGISDVLYGGAALSKKVEVKQSLLQAYGAQRVLVA